MQDVTYYIVIFILGTIFGSFYNVIIYRLPLNISIAKGRSMCLKCKHTLNVLDLVPLFSYIFLGGKCRYCKEKLSPRYFIIEFITGILFIISYFYFSLSLKFLYMILFWSMLIITTMIDIDEGYIYDKVLIYFMIPILLIKLIFIKESIIQTVISGVVGFVIYYTIYFSAKKYYKREAFGLGDVYLMTAIGLTLNMKLTIMVCFLSFIVALIIIGIRSLFGSKFNLNQELPFGPYMCLTAFLLSIYGEKLFTLYINYAFS